jgi:hypothetical protein
MSTIVSKYYPISDIYFENGKKPVDLTPGGGLINQNEPPVIGIHVFNWSPESYMIVETGAGQTVTFPPTSLVEGAIYYLKIRKLLKVAPSPQETQIMAISPSEQNS